MYEPMEIINGKQLSSSPPRQIDQRSDSPPPALKVQPKPLQALRPPQQNGIIARTNAQKAGGALPLCISNKAAIVPRESNKDKDKDKLPIISKPAPRLKGVCRYKVREKYHQRYRFHKLI